MHKIVNRLKRLEGQIAKVREDIEAGTLCPLVMPQFLATKGALEATIHEYLQLAIIDCAENSKPEELSCLLKTIIKKL
jgi:DNA-binding FrmR family transcriptional regulator